ncbi:hypothetical protein QAD02_005934 [Eretmocerus hayati]|uniref:Uncharacterized protein n=1 Tax=Eretmocerus hayati TaxID=131215 RepID=A0ACC2N1P9_9HYME|nr:hypothetical protein QAD02_005934 [Eretmocerus hayati]
MMIGSLMMLRLNHILVILQMMTSTFIKLSTAEPILGNTVEKVTQNDYPFVVSFFGYDREPMIEKRHFCGGTLISGKHVLTAGHCILSENLMKQAEVQAGSHKLKPRSKLQIFKPISWLKYEDRRKEENELSDLPYHDIAVVKLNVDDTGIAPAVFIPLRESQDTEVKTVTLVGWGRTNDKVIPSNLRRASLQPTLKADCVKKAQRIAMGYDWNRVKGDHVLCFTASPCVHGMPGDSGSPYLDEQGRLAGVHSGRCPPLRRFDPLQFNVGMSINFYRCFIDHAKNFLEDKAY